MIQNEWNGRTGVCPSRVLQREKLKGGLNNRKWTNQTNENVFFFLKKKKEEEEKSKRHILDVRWWMGPPSTTAIQLHTCDKQEMRPDISRWHGEDRWVSRWQQAPLSRSLDILSLPLSLHFQCLFEHGSTSAHRRRAKNPPPSALIENATINRSFDDGHTTAFFFLLSLFLHVLVFRISRSTCERIVVALLASFR